MSESTRKLRRSAPALQQRGPVLHFASGFYLRAQAGGRVIALKKETSHAPTAAASEARSQTERGSRAPLGLVPRRQISRRNISGAARNGRREAGRVLFGFQESASALERGAAPRFDGGAAKRARPASLLYTVTRIHGPCIDAGLLESDLSHKQPFS